MRRGEWSRVEVMGLVYSKKHQPRSVLFKLRCVGLRGEEASRAKERREESRRGDISILQQNPLTNAKGFLVGLGGVEARRAELG